MGASKKTGRMLTNSSSRDTGGSDVEMAITGLEERGAFEARCGQLTSVRRLVI